MKNWIEAKHAYLTDHLNKPLKFPDIRIRSLNNIENAMKENFPELLKSNEIFKKYDKERFGDLYASLKERRLNSADKSVIHGLFKFSK